MAPRGSRVKVFRYLNVAYFQRVTFDREFFMEFQIESVISWAPKYVSPNITMAFIQGKNLLSAAA